MVHTHSKFSKVNELQVESMILMAPLFPFPSATGIKTAMHHQRINERRKAIYQTKFILIQQVWAFSLILLFTHDDL